MQTKKILKQALLFEHETPSYSAVRELFRAIKEYEQEHSVFILEGRRGKKLVLHNKEAFFAFLSEQSCVEIKALSDLKNYFSTSSRKENIEFAGDSKHRYIKVFDHVLICKKQGENAQIYQEDKLFELLEISSFVAVENGESFLNIDTKAEHFSAEYFIYLGGYANSLTRRFLQDKEVEFFLDFDIEGMQIYESFEVKKKSFHLPQNLEYYFQSPNFNSQKLYQKQRAHLKKEYAKELSPLLKLIKKYATVVEQEIVYEA